MLLVILTEKKVELFKKKNCKKQIKKEFRVEKVIKRKHNKLYLKKVPTGLNGLKLKVDKLLNRLNMMIG